MYNHRISTLSEFVLKLSPLTLFGFIFHPKKEVKIRIIWANRGVGINTQNVTIPKKIHSCKFHIMENKCYAMQMMSLTCHRIITERAFIAFCFKKPLPNFFCSTLALLLLLFIFLYYFYFLSTMLPNTHV